MLDFFSFMMDEDLLQLDRDAVKIDNYQPQGSHLSQVINLNSFPPPGYFLIMQMNGLDWATEPANLEMPRKKCVQSQCFK